MTEASKSMTVWRIIILAIVLAAVAGVIYLRGDREAAPAPDEASVAAEGAMPRLVDLGADKCVPCKMMAPILEQLEKDFAGQFEVDFIDVWKNRAAGSEYAIRSIPTQIFFDGEGTELFRHVGFFSREDILAAWKRLGYEFTAPAGSAGVTGEG